jgi:hypothetical protein
VAINVMGAQQVGSLKGLLAWRRVVWSRQGQVNCRNDVCYVICACVHGHKLNWQKEKGGKESDIMRRP